MKEVIVEEMDEDSIPYDEDDLEVYMHHHLEKLDNSNTTPE